MQELLKPRALKAGDTIALISISGGRGGDDDMISRLYEGKRRLEEIYQLNVLMTPNALMGSDYLYKHPEARGADLMWAIKNKDVHELFVLWVVTTLIVCYHLSILMPYMKILRYLWAILI